jgi:hypothetical protein
LAVLTVVVDVVPAITALPETLRGPEKFQLPDILILSVDKIFI